MTTIILMTSIGLYRAVIRLDLPAADWMLAAAAAGDDALAPPVADQPAPLETREVTATTSAVGYLARAGGAWASGLRAVGIFFLAIGVVGAVVLVTLIVAVVTSNAITLGTACASIACGLYLLAAMSCSGLVSLRIGRIASGRVFVWADEDSVQWARRLGTVRRARIAWRDVRAFGIVIRHRDSDYSLLQTYALTTDATTFAWRVGDHRGRPAEVEASDQLCRLVVTHTGLPLRNLSAAANPATVRQLEDDRRRERDRGAEPAAPPGAPGRSTRLADIARYAGCLPIAVFGTLSIVKWVLQWLQAHH
jgi:hypothetical protein